MGRKKMRTRHHLSPRSRYKEGLKTPWGQDDPENLVILWDDKHALLHKIFGNRTLEEIIAVLQRLQRMKGRRK